MGILAESSSDNVFAEYLIKNKIRHIKIPLYSAWIGSAWERMIKTMKNSLHKTVGRKRLQYFDLLTLLSDIQDSVNSRPLTYVESDASFDCLSPNSFLIPSSGQTLVLDGEAGTELAAPTRRDLVKALVAREDLLESVKTKWVEDYLISLREAGRDMYQSDWINKVNVGEIVLISVPNKTRPYWQMGRITELLPGRDGIVRSVKLIRPDRSEGVYSIKHLYPLELSVLPVNVGVDVSQADDANLARFSEAENSARRYNLRSSK